jgi:hypothetical protein
MLTKLALTALTATLVAGCGRGGPDASEEASLEELTRVLSVMTMAGKKPASVYDLTNFPSLQGRRLPVPPAGKKLAIDEQTRQVVFTNK